MNIRRRPSLQVLLVAAGFMGALGGGWLVGRWCFGLVLIAESCLVVWVGLFRDDGHQVAEPGVRTLENILEYQRHVP